MLWFGFAFFLFSTEFQSVVFWLSKCEDTFKKLCGEICNQVDLLPWQHQPGAHGFNQGWAEFKMAGCIHSADSLTGCKVGVSRRTRAGRHGFS